ncbi:DUF559 domain-containing protein [Leifsonia sp. 2TAF2]|uniref:DUF559 domain-containing protein n=1 Tax=Leifsonia sp. 2TAF2 TaxID=3233009 RepID=UPI003F9A0F50
MQSEPLHRILERFGGIATRGQLVGSGAPPDHLAAAVREGSILRVRRAHYAAVNADPRAVSAVRIGGRLTASSAARSYGLWGGLAPQLHVRVPSNGSRIRPPITSDPVRLHWVDGTLSPYCWRDTLEDCLVASVHWETDETAVAVLDTALGGGHLTKPRLSLLLASEGARARRLARSAQPGSESGVESLARQRFAATGRFVEQQVQVPGIGRVDMRIDGKLLVEFDGYASHGSKDAFERDRVRDSRARLRGTPVVRFTARQVLEQWPVVVETIDALLEREAA